MNHLNNKKRRDVSRRFLFAFWRLFKKDRRSRVQKKKTEGPAEHGGVECCRGKRGKKRAEHARRDGRAQRGSVEIPVFPVCEERHARRGEEVEQVDRLRRALLHAEKERHAQKQQRPAADAPGREDARQKPAERAQEPCRHRRYLAAP